MSYLAWVLSIFLAACPAPSHPGIAIEDVDQYPGVTAYAPRWQAPMVYTGTTQLIGVQGIRDGSLGPGYTEIVLDEPTWQGQSVTQTIDSLNAYQLSYPDTLVGVVEPFAADIDALLLAGGRPDFVAGEDYGGAHRADITLDDLNFWKSQYGVQTQQWVVGASNVMGYEGRVDLVIAADVYGTWPDTRSGDYSQALRSLLSQTCRQYLPVAAVGQAYP